jgi:hypothetical protein
MNSQKCVIFLHGKPLANGADSNIKIARRHAATKGLKRLKDEAGLLESICNCKISLIKRGILKKSKKKAYDSDEEDE